MDKFGTSVKIHEKDKKGKIEIELVAFGDGVEVFKTTNHYDSLLTALQLKGVILAQCLNTMKERKIDKNR